MNLNTSDQSIDLPSLLTVQGSPTQQNYTQPNYKRLTLAPFYVERNFIEKFYPLYDINVTSSK